MVPILAPMNEFAVNLAPEFVDDGYLKILVVGKSLSGNIKRDYRVFGA